jgi:prephenate dehydrogenase
LRASASVVVTDAGSIKGPILDAVARLVGPQELERFVPGHPLGGSERSGPDHASAHVIDGIVWVLAPGPSSSRDAVTQVERVVTAMGATVVELTPDRHDRLVAFVSHLPQVASSMLMGLAATEEDGEPDILLLAAGGFRDLTRLAASNPALWSEILVANAGQIAAAIDLYVERLLQLRDDVLQERRDDVESAFGAAKSARLRLAAKPLVRAGVEVLRVEIPDEPGALARITGAIGPDVNIEDLQIVHSPEGGRGNVHLTVAASSAEVATRALTAEGYDPIRLA